MFEVLLFFFSFSLHPIPFFSHSQSNSVIHKTTMLMHVKYRNFMDGRKCGCVGVYGGVQGRKEKH